MERLALLNKEGKTEPHIPSDWSNILQPTGLMTLGSNTRTCSEPGSQLVNDESQLYGLFKVTTPQVSPIEVKLQVNEVDTTMEVDTGAALSVMSNKKYQQLCKGHGPPFNRPISDSRPTLERS